MKSIKINYSIIYRYYPKDINKKTFYEIAKKYFGNKGYKCLNDNFKGFLPRYGWEGGRLYNWIKRNPNLFEDFKKMCYNKGIFRNNGLPDLFVFNKKECFFCEIKSENDGLRINQFEWLYKNKYRKIKTIILFILNRRITGRMDTKTYNYLYKNYHKNKINI